MNVRYKIHFFPRETVSHQIIPQMSALAIEFAVEKVCPLSNNDVPL